MIEKNAKREKNKTNVLYNAISSLFLLFCIFMLVITVWQTGNTGSISKETISNTLLYNIYKKQSYINLYGAVQRIAGKKAVEDFSIFRNSYEKLIQPQVLLTNNEISTQVKQIIPIVEYCHERDIPIIYFTSILPVQDKVDLPYRDIDFQEENAECLFDIIKAENIPYYDLRNINSIKAIPKEDLFYRTDHHWSIKTCFTAYQELIKEWNKSYDFNIDERLLDLENYDTLVWKKAFLGSYGVKVGKYYNGCDDFVVYAPKFDTYLYFDSYDSEGNLILQKDGEWLTCLMDQEILDDPLYLNKYNAWSNSGYVENRVVNKLADNNLRVLYISHSYGRPMTQYLALCFSEVRNLDPQEGRFTGNYLDYLDDYDPDIVILQGESEGRLYGVYNTER